jgi:hypothetical protein
MFGFGKNKNLHNFIITDDGRVGFIESVEQYHSAFGYHEYRYLVFFTDCTRNWVDEDNVAYFLKNVSKVKLWLNILNIRPSVIGKGWVTL